MHSVHEEILAFIDDERRDTFEALALRVFAHQFDSIEPYRLFCTARNRTPSTVSDWQQIPPVPIQAFKQLDLRCGTPQRIFLSTGTTQGAERRSRHCLPDLRLYHRSAIGGLRSFLLPDVERIRIISLVPPVARCPDSSLAQMVAWAMEHFGDEGSGYAVGDTGVEWDCLVEALRGAEHTGRLCCLMTTTAALLRVFDHVRDRRLSFRLPHGSRLMDTGGEKGLLRRLSRSGVLHAVWNTFAIPGYFCVNEYGMTELSSQYYDNVIAHRFSGRYAKRFKTGPHWVRTLVLAPGSLRPVPA
ncbi:MAG: hypothetical protein A2W26_09135, partial [Acidobacteria bacterium RBG_16_64_8]